MKLLKAIFSLPFIINVLIGFLLVVGLVFGLRKYLGVFTHHDEKVEIPDISKMKLFDALPVLQQAGLKYEIDSFKFDDKFESYTIFDVYPAMGSDVKKGRRIFIRANPKTWAPVAIPNLKDQYKNNAFRRLEQVGLTLGDTIYEPHKYQDVVLRMMHDNRVISPGTYVPRFSKIDLVIGASLQKDVPMISVIGLPLNDAKNEIERNMFEVGRVDDRDVLNKDMSNAVVFYQSPAPGDIYDEGESVILFVTDQPIEDLEGRIAELNGIYRKRIKTDSTGTVNYDFERRLDAGISRDVKRQVNAGIDESTARGEKKKEEKQTVTPTNTQGNATGVVVE